MYTKWLIDPLHTFVRFEAHYLLLTKVHGWCTEFDGIFHAKEPFEINSVEFSIYVNSLQTGNAERDRQLKSARFLNNYKFPVISYSADSIQAAGSTMKAYGLLRIKDVERKTVLKLDHKGFATDQYGNMKAGLAANIRISAGDFNLAFDELCRHDQHHISDEINIQIDLQLLKFNN